MKTPTSFKRLILRAVLRKVSPMVIRVLAVPDYLDLSRFDEVFRTLFGWDGLGFSFHIHGQEFTSFLRRTRAQRKTLGDFQLRPRETFLYTCGGIDLWEWEFRLLDSEAGSNGDEAPVCLAGRGASPPEHCGGPTGYRLMLKRQKEGDLMGTPGQVEAVIALPTAAHPDQPTSSWDILREVMDDGMRSIDRRLEQYGLLKPNRESSGNPGVTLLSYSSPEGERFPPSPTGTLILPPLQAWALCAVHGLQADGRMSNSF